MAGALLFHVSFVIDCMNVFWTSIVAGVLLLLFEALLVFRLWQLTGKWKSDMAAAGRKRVSPEPTPTRV